MKLRGNSSVVVAVAVIALGATALAGCGKSKNESAGSTNTSAATPSVTGTLSASDQPSDGMTIKVASVSISGAPGWIAVHTDLDGKPGPVAGKKSIPMGESKDVVITLDKAVTTGAFWPMLHVDAGTVGTYEFPGADVPVMSGSDIVMKKVTLTVASGTKY
jgi:hypothetical protein